MSSTNPGKMPNDEPSFNTPLNGGEGSLDTLTDEARVEPLHQTQLSSDVKHLTATVMDLAGSVKAAMVKFQQVDHRLEEFHQIQTVMHGNMERVDKFLSMVDKPNLGESTPKCGIKSKAPAESAVSKKKRKNARATSEILKNDVINIDLDFEKNEVEDINTDSAGSNPSKGILTPWLQKSFRSPSSVEGLVGAFVRQEVEQTRTKLYVTPPSSKRATSSSSTFRSPISGPQTINPVNQARLYMRPLPRPLVPKGARPKFEIPPELDLLLTDAQVATYLFEEDSDPDEILLSMGRYEAVRRDFDCLIPGQQITDKIITLVAVKIMREQSTLMDHTIWCFPPSFVEDVYKGFSVEKLCQEYLRPFMYPFNTLTYIYIPIKTDSGHWYLCIISIADYTIYHLDSHLNADDIPFRCASMKTLCTTLVEMMTTEDRYVESKFFKKMVDFHSWKLKEARGILNTGSSHDSAVWLLSWLELGSGFNPNQSGYPNERAVRMNTAATLLCGEHNDMRRSLEEKAHVFWNARHTADFEGVAASL